MPLQQIAVLSPKNLMEMNNGTEKQSDERQTSTAGADGNLTQSEGSPDTNEHTEAAKRSEASLYAGQAEAAPVETCVKIKSGGASVDSTEERSDTNTDSSGDSQDNRAVETAAVTARTDDNSHVADVRRSGKRAKKEKPSPVKKKETQVKSSF